MATNNKQLLNNRKSFFRFWFIILLLIGLMPSYLSAQTAGNFFRMEDGELKVYQRFVWSGGENASRYQVVFERLVDEDYVTHFIEFTDLLYIEISLPPGDYRIQVIPYDILGRPHHGSEWSYVQILPSPQHVFPDLLPEPDPVIEFVSEPEPITQIEPEYQPEMEPVVEPQPETDTWYEPELETETLYEPEPEIEQPQVEFEPEPQFEIEPVIEPQPETDTWYEPELETEPLYEPEPELVSDFRPVVQEPQPVQEPELPINWDLGSTIFSAGFYWAPLFTIYGNDFADNSTLEGMGLRISLAFYTSRYNMYIGAELTALVSSGDEFFSSIDGYTVSAGANLLALKWMSNQRVALGMRLGASYPLVFGSSYKDNDGFSFNQIIPCVGLSLRWRVTDLFLFETGVDFSNIFGDVLVGYLRPWIGVGIQF